MTAATRGSYFYIFIPAAPSDLVDYWLSLLFEIPPCEMCF